MVNVLGGVEILVKFRYFVGWGVRVFSFVVGGEEVMKVCIFRVVCGRGRMVIF